MSRRLTLSCINSGYSSFSSLAAKGSPKIPAEHGELDGARAEFESEGFRPAVEGKPVMAQTQRAAGGSEWCMWAEGGIGRASGWKAR